jgi:hypothetical protein
MNTWTADPLILFSAQVEDEKTKLEYASILEKFEQFNTSLNTYFDRLEQIKRMLDATKKKNSQS